MYVSSPVFSRDLLCHYEDSVSFLDQVGIYSGTDISLRPLPLLSSPPTQRLTYLIRCFVKRKPFLFSRTYGRVTYPLPHWRQGREKRRPNSQIRGTQIKKLLKYEKYFPRRKVIWKFLFPSMFLISCLMDFESWENIGNSRETTYRKVYRGTWTHGSIYIHIYSHWFIFTTRYDT